jgi:hypothetical protein
MRFVHWYNHEHRHSGLRYVSPAQRHAGQDNRMLAARHAVCQEERSRNPQRWSGQTRDWTPIGVVTLNPERDTVVRAATSEIQLSGSISELLSRPDLATPKPRRATKEMGGAEPPGAARRAHWPASMARLASTEPSPP